MPDRHADWLAPIPFNGPILLQCEMPGASVVWTALEIHAERISTGKQVIAELDRSRTEFPPDRKLNFAESSYDDQTLGNPAIEWIAKHGFRLHHTAKTQQCLSFFSLREQPKGDFDISVDVNVETNTKPIEGESVFRAEVSPIYKPISTFRRENDSIPGSPHS